MSVEAIFRQVLSIVSRHPLLERLLVASLELVVVTTVVLAIIHMARVRSNRVIALMWVIALAKPILGITVGTLAPVFDVGPLGLVSEPAAAASHVETVAELRGVPETTARSGAAAIAAAVGTASAAAVRAAFDPARALTGVWIIGAAILSFLSIADRLRIRRLVAAAAAPGPEIESMYREAGLAGGGGHNRRLPRLLISDRLESPAMAGTLFPVIFLPAWMTRRPDRERIVWSLRHELTHWRRRDHLAGFVGEVARVLFFFHPLVWWIGRKWKVATEIACDEAMVATRSDARRYAEQLYQILARVHTRRRIMLANGLFATRTQIGKRIELLLKSNPRGKAGRKLPAVVFLSLFGALVFSLGAEMSTEARPGKNDKTIVVKKDDKSSSVVTATIHEDDGRTVVLTTKGEVEFNEEKNDIVSISPDGKFLITDVHDGVERELKVVPKDDGKLEWTYEVDGKKKPFDDEARKWFRELLEDLHVDTHGELVLVTKPNVVIKRPIVIDDSKGSHIEVRVVEPHESIDIYEGDDGKRVIKMRISDDEDDAEVWIHALGDVERTEGEHVVVSVTPSGKIRITVKKDGDEHELEVTPGDGDPEYKYKLNGEAKPYGAEQKKIFEKYLRHMEDGFELHTGEKI
jgi:beta-lactamase regulating signal transducer with metallopeptidase domain